MRETVVGRNVAIQKLEAFERLQPEFEASLCFIQDVHGQRRFPTFPVAETVHYLHALWICAQKDRLLSVSKEHGRYRGNEYLELLHAWQEGKTAVVVAFLQQALDGLPFADLTRKIEEATSESPPPEGRARHLAHGRLVLLNRGMNLLQAVDAIFMLSEDDLMREVHIACAEYGHTPSQIEQQLAERNDERFAPVPHPLLAQRNMVAMNTLGMHAIDQYTDRESVRAWSHVTPADALHPVAGHLMSENQEQRSPGHAVQVGEDLLTQVHDAIIIHTPDGRILSWNQGAEALYGWMEQEACRKPVHTLLKTRFYASREAVNLVLVTRGHWRGQLTQTSRTGERLIVDSRQIFVSAKVGHPAMIMEMNQDITEREQFLQEQAEAKAREGVLHETARQMDAFLGRASHELKTPLTSMKGNLQRAQHQLTRLHQQEAEFNEALARTLPLVQTSLQRVERQINIQTRLVNDLLDVSRIQTNQLTLQRTRCDLVPLVREAIENQRTLAPTRTIRWHTLVPQAEVLADADRVGQVINNYLSNALKYSEADTPVEVCLEQEEARIRVSVRDQGPGLSQAQQQQIWKQFHRLEDIEVKSGGGVSLGLGLSISQTLIEHQGGHVGVVSTPGNGSTFWFTLPCGP